MDNTIKQRKSGKLLHKLIGRYRQSRCFITLWSPSSDTQKDPNWAISFRRPNRTLSNSIRFYNQELRALYNTLPKLRKLIKTKLIIKVRKDEKQDIQEDIKEQ